MCDDKVKCFVNQVPMLSVFSLVATPEIRWVHVDSREVVAIDKIAIRLPPVGRGGQRDFHGLGDILQGVFIPDDTFESMLQAELFHDRIEQGFARFVVSVKFLGNMSVLQSFNEYVFTGELLQIRSRKSTVHFRWLGSMDQCPGAK